MTMNEHPMPIDGMSDADQRALQLVADAASRAYPGESDCQGCIGLAA